MGKKKGLGRMDENKAASVEQRAYRFLGHPDEGQEALLRQFAGSTRFLWNRMLDDWDTSYREKGKSDPVKTPADYKKEPGLEWLKDMDSLALANTQVSFVQAANDFLDGSKGKPRFKSRHDCRDSYTTNCSNKDNPNLRLDGCFLKLPKIETPIRLELHRPIQEGGTFKRCTVKHEPDGRWYFSLTFEYPKQEVQPAAAGKSPDSIRAIGLDMSLPELYVDSDGDTPAYPKPYRTLQKRIAVEQHKLSRMVKGSSNYKKQKQRIARLHAKARHQRADFLHKLSYRLVRDYDVICIEDLDMASIKKALSFGKSVSDNGWGMFVSMLEYKAARAGCTIVKVDKWFPSSKTCCKCGHVHKELTLSDRTYECPVCGNVMGRDHQAAINIREEGLRIYFGLPSQAA